LVGPAKRGARSGAMAQEEMRSVRSMGRAMEIVSDTGCGGSKWG
jgi:hypothetical protein